MGCAAQHSREQRAESREQRAESRESREQRGGGHETRDTRHQISAGGDPVGGLIAAAPAEAAIFTKKEDPKVVGEKGRP